MKVSAVSPDSALMEAVIALGDKHSDQLGFFPLDAFRRSAQLGRILGAVDESGNLRGYLLYYIALGRVVLQHLCVAESSRGAGVARGLVSHLRKLTSHFYGISLHCRRDYPAHSMWPRLGFHAVTEKKGRGKTAEPLTCFWLDYGHPDLMSALTETLAQSKHVVVLDANVVYDLLEPTRTSAGESRALLADWLKDSIRLWVTDELFNEIGNTQDKRRRERARGFIRGMPKVVASSDSKQAICLELASMFPDRRTARDAADHRHLACAIAADAPFFVTRDEDLTERAEELRTRFGINVLRPADLVLRFDELRRVAEYEPARLAGTAIHIGKVGPADTQGLVDAFLDHGRGETKSEFSTRLRLALSNPQTHSTLLVRDRSGKMAALLVLRFDADAVNVPVLRVAGGALQDTLARNIGLRAITESLRRGRTTTVITEPCASRSVREALAELGFSCEAGQWSKLHLAAIASSEAMAAHLRALTLGPSLNATMVESLAADTEAIGRQSDPRAAAAAIEKRIWPGRIDSAHLCNFIVPIQARWAQHLFDEELASQTLFGAVPALALNCEHVYYRAARPGVLRAPGRVLWYVSDDAKYKGTRCLRACSSLDEVVIGPATELYRRFRRLGVFEWGDVKAIARGEAHRPIMAFRFGVTEPFRSPLERHRLTEILRHHGKPDPPLSTPYAVSSACFRELYSVAAGIADK